MRSRMFFIFSKPRTSRYNTRRWSIAYLDNIHKIAVVVNRTVSIAQLTNAIAHCCAGLAEAVGGEAEFLDYECPVGGWKARISRWPFVVLAGKNSGQLARFASEATRDNLRFNCFTAAMIGNDAEEQIRQTREDSAPEYWVVAAFGAAEELRPITKRFSLFSYNEPS